MKYHKIKEKKNKVLTKSLRLTIPSYPIVEESKELISTYLIGELILGKVVTVGYKGKIYNFQNIGTHYSEDATPFQEEVGVWRFMYPIASYIHTQQIEHVRQSIEKFIYEKEISVGDIYE